MKVVHHAARLDIPKLLNVNMPWLYEFYTDKAELGTDAQDLFAFHIGNGGNLPFYTINDKLAENIKKVSETAYSVMVQAVEYAFTDRELLKKHFDCEMLRSSAGGHFIDYAAWTFNERNMLGQSLYSRFDLAVDPVRDEVTGIYELNADTPTMLFESTTLQDNLLQAAGFHEDRQKNDWYETINNTLCEMPLSKSHNFGVVFDGESIDDSATCEIIAELLGEHTTACMVDMRHLSHEDLNRKQPFTAYDIVFDGLFVLVPWEEMVVDFPKAILQWQNWCDNVVIMEPAWKWFMSNKGIFSLITELEERGILNTKGVPFLKTYLAPEKLALAGKQYVRKPKVGRMSANVSIVNPLGITLEENGAGPYAAEQMVYQEYQPPGKIDPERNFILGVWMAPQPIHFGKDATAAGFCVRDFNSGVTNFGDEQFIPHVRTVL